MRLVTFFQGASRTGPSAVGVLVPLGGAVGTHTHVVDLSAAFASYGGTPLYNGMRQLLELGKPGMERAAAAAASGRWRIPLADVSIGAPIYNPEKVLCVGMNYRDHCTEQNFPIPEEPVIFSKFASSIAASGDPLELDFGFEPGQTKELDWEVEFVAVVGRGGKDIPKEEALDYIAGWTVAHDVSARDWQLTGGGATQKKNAGQWLLGKTMDGYCPIGPSIVTRDEAPAFTEANNLGVKCTINGETVQNSNTYQFIFTPADCVAFISRFMTLKPGDMILTGTPGGVGVFRKPPVYLKVGDEVTCEIEGIGAITNAVVTKQARPKL
jgi:2-keto-4-pentenoate hydratase/2-oxohepta-3-ene-1,7-dioic acid hydratase in catechol pathway